MIVFLCPSMLTCDLTDFSSSDDRNVAPLAQPTPQFPLQQPTDASADRSIPHYSSDVHPIAALVQDAEQQFTQLLDRQSRTLADAVKEYRRRYNMHPPPYFDKWFKFAQSRGVELIDEYDTIYHSLLPFWALTPQTIRARAREALGYDNSLFGVLIRDGTVSLAEGLDEEHKWQREATLGMVKDFVQYLPDMDLAFNAHDEPRVIVPSEDLQRLVAVAKDRAIPKAFGTKSAVNAWSARSDDLNKGDRIDEVRITRFNKISHQPAWTSSRISCPVDSPVRSLDENAPDDTTRYALGELGFIHNTTAFTDVCNTPSLRNTYGFFDRPNVFAVVQDLFPVFSQSKVSTFQDILYPSPWYWAKKVPYMKEKDYSWEEKIDKLYWRGSTTGGFSKGGGWRRHHRQLMVGNINALDTARTMARSADGQWVNKEVKLSKHHNLFDVQFTSVGQCDRNDCAAQKEFFNVTDPVEQQEAWAYKYLVDIDGNAFSGRYHAFLESNSLVCKVALFREWHDERLKPWLHYVPLSLKGDEFVETMRYFTSDEEAHNRLWDLSKKWTAFSHQFHTLKNGFKFHYVSNETEATTTAKKPLVIFIHGFPDSWAIWRHILRSESLQENATLVAVDLPGYGGSDGVDRYSATTVLESLTEFIIAMRTRYGIDNSSGSYQQRVVVVSHDWGCVLSLRLASESPELADRFIVSNGPLVPLGLSNISRRLSSSSKMLKSFLRSPIRSRALLFNAIKTVKPIFRQLWASGYIFIFQLPPILVDYLGKGGNQSFLKGIHKMSYGKQEFSIIDAADCMASSLGPTIEEGKTETANGEKYADSAISPRAISKFVEMCSYYRDGTAFSRWRKSVETIASLHGIAQETGIGRTSSGAAIFDDGPAGALKASTTIVWGKKDRALNAELCLDGISDYLGPRSQVIELPAIRHWTPLEPGGRVALTKVIKWAIGGEREDIGAVFAGHDDIARTVYDELIPVYRMTNHTPANLWLMERPDLIATFTKIELWKQIQYKRIVYIDCDVVSIRAPDELLELDVDFAAAPDVGWPDIFNSGVMVLRPNLQDYYALRALAERGISFDGADQGLLNIHFRDWHRLSFTYNCTPSANYQYIPAYKHFQSTISLIHFIGSQKPWNMPRQVAPFDSPFNQLLGRWWTIYDRHYRSVAIVSYAAYEFIVGPVPDTVHPQPQTERSGQQYSEHIEHAPSGPASEPYHHHHHDHHRQPRSEFSNSQPEYHAPAESSHETAHMSYPPESSNASLPSEHVHHAHAEHHSWQPVQEPIYSVVPQYVRGEEHVRAYLQQQPLQDHIRHHTQPPQEHIHHQIQPPHEHQPSVSSEPRPSQHHDPHPAQSHAPAEMQREPSPQPPPEEQIFEAPKSEWDASREPPPLDSKPEGYALETKTYTMSEDKQLFQPPDSYPEAPKNMWYEVPATKPQPQKIAQIFPWETSAPKPTRVFAHKERQVEPASSPIPSREEPRESQSPQPTSWTSEIASLPSESFDTYSRSNAWDEVPEIQKYIQSIQQARKARVQVLSGDFTNQSTTYPFSTLPGNFSGRGTRVTDFPTEFERPSLPVTPAPIHRGPALGSPDDYTTAQLPAAEGVPSQEDWVGLTVDVFLHLLRVTYLYWEFTESFSSARGVAAAQDRRFG
ncbi:hypothetical protein BJY04DRAFT_207670 [Aspergillus karnatakaensis]|uniref:uncharacterized protein n=1 Tax=Aspergillus karnatakaensis TaxID=1810916 RepID=UPI003CCCE4F3